MNDSAAEVVAAVFDRAAQRDPGRRRPWVVLVDGDRRRIDSVRAEARRGTAHLVDLVHVLELLWRAALFLYGEGDPRAGTRVARTARTLLTAGAQAAAAELRAAARTAPSGGARHTGIDAAVDCLIENAEFLRYGTASERGWPVATGVIEGTSRHLTVEDRLEMAGARWSPGGAEAVLKLRAVRASFGACWVWHQQQESLHNHQKRYPSPLSLNPLAQDPHLICTERRLCSRSLCSRSADGGDIMRRSDSSVDPTEAAVGEGMLRRSRDLPAPRMAEVILIAAICCYTGITVLNILNSGVHGLGLAAAGACLTVLFALQILHSQPGARRAPARRRALTLGLQVLVTYLPLVAFEAQWGAMAGFLAGSLLLLLPPRPGWILYGLVGVSMLVPPVLGGRSVLDSAYLVQTTLLTGLVTFGLARLSDLVRVLHESRGELARAAVTRERLRFARDLHDLLGYSLSAIQLKGELIHRLIAANPEMAKQEIEDVLAISRQSLADVRRVASGYRDLSLKEEIGSARSVLSAAEVETVTDVRIGSVSSPVDTVLATVLREAVTNVLRHSRATYCGITAVEEDGLMTLSISNDGVIEGYCDSSPHSGSGLGNLELRLRAVGGDLTIDRGSADAFRLVARAPAHGELLAGTDGPMEDEAAWMTV